MREVNAEQLLEGPRGRRLCAEIGNQGRYAWDDPDWYESLWQKRIGQGSAKRAVNPNAPPPPPRKTDFAEIAGIGEPELVWRLADAVAWAMYWQPPDDEDQMLARPEVRQALVPIAEQVLRAEAAQWWDRPMDPVRQRYVEWLDEVPNGPPQLEGSSVATQCWRAKADEREQAAKSWPESLAFPMTADWWSTPDVNVRVTTSRALPWLGAVGLMLNEDDAAWEHACVWPLKPNLDARIYDIADPESWAALVERYPFDVTFSRRHDWWHVTGRDGKWFIPDWQAIAADYDGVHLTVLGYLTTAGRAIDLEIEGGATVLAGWDPDDTWWFNDVLQISSSEQPVEWRLHQQPDVTPDEWRKVRFEG